MLKTFLISVRSDGKDSIVAETFMPAPVNSLPKVPGLAFARQCLASYGTASSPALPAGSMRHQRPEHLGVEANRRRAVKPTNLLLHSGGCFGFTANPSMTVRRAKSALQSDQAGPAGRIQERSADSLVRASIDPSRETRGQGCPRSSMHPFSNQLWRSGASGNSAS